MFIILGFLYIMYYLNNLLIYVFIFQLFYLIFIYIFYYKIFIIEFSLIINNLYFFSINYNYLIKFYKYF